MDLITRNAIRAHLAFSAAVLGLTDRARSDRGQGSVEYVGIIIVVVGIIAAIVGFKDQIGGAIAGALQTAVESISNVGGE